MLGIGDSLPEDIRFQLFVVLFGMLLLVAMAYVLLKPIKPVTVFGISLIVGGGISNLIDRLIHEGSVIDFLLFKVGALESGIFNVADVAITLGMCVLCFTLVRSTLNKP